MTYQNQRCQSRQRNRLQARLSLSDGRRQFRASVHTRDISSTGAFLDSTFRLKPGTVLDVVLEMPGSGRPVRTRASVIRQQAPARKDCGGFAIHFAEPLAARTARALMVPQETSPETLRKRTGDAPAVTPLRRPLRPHRQDRTNPSYR